MVCPLTGLSDGRAELWHQNSNPTRVSNEIVDIDRRLQVQAYPNPSQGQITFDLGDNAIGETSVQIFDIMGRSVFEHQSNSSSKLIWNGLDTQGKTLPNGTYLVEIRTEKGISHSSVSLLR